MAACSAATVLAAAYRAGYAKLSERDLQACVVSSACRAASLASCNAQTLLQLAFANGYAKLSERSLRESQTYAACAGSSGSGNAQDLVNADAATRLAGMSWRDLEASQVASECFTATCVGPLAPTTLAVVGTTTSSITFSWAQPLSIPPVAVGAYVIRWGSSSGNYDIGSATISGALTSYSITGLSASETVYITVQAIGSDGCNGGTSAELSASSSSANPFLVSLTALWSMDEDIADGTRVDVIGGNNLTDDNLAIPAVRGLLNGACAFANGSSNSLSHADNADLGAGPGVSFTCVAWVNGAASNPGFIGERSAGGTVDWVYNTQNGSFSASDLGGTNRVVTILPAGTATWHMVAFGYDDGTGLMWQSLDGGARSTLAITGVRKSGQPFRITMDGGLVDQVGLWKRALTVGEVTSLYNSGNGLIYPFLTGTGAQYANTWNWAVQHNGGAAVAGATVTAAGTMIDGYISNSIFSKLIYVLPLVESLTAGRTPIVVTWKNVGSFPETVGADPVANHNFVGGDLGINGLTGNGSTKYLDCTLVPSASIASIDDVAFFAYVYNTASAAQTDMGCYSFDNNHTMLLTANESGNSVGAMGVNGVNISAAAKGNGYFCVSRTSSVLITGYFANSTNPHAAYASNVGSNAGAGLSGLSVPIFALNVAGVIVNFSASTLSGSGIATGLAAADSLALFTLWQAFRTATGGGFQ